MVIIDAHLDLSWNALNWNRDLTLPVSEIRRFEVGMKERNPTANGWLSSARATGTVAFPEMRRGQVAVCLATLLARASNLDEDKLDYRSQEIAYAMAQGQLAYYRVMEEEGHLRMLRDAPALAAQVRAWAGSGGGSVPLGFVLSMEGADPIVSPAQVAEWWEAGLRVVGLAHYGAGAYAHGTASVGGLTVKGRDLLKAMQETGMILDATHLADESFWDALDLFQGPVLASHNNCRALVPGDRQFSDEQIRRLIERGSVIGACLDAWMLYPGWVSGETSNSVVGLGAVVDHIDHICQLAGDARHAAIGSDLDGGFGTAQCPHGLDTIADLQKIPERLRQRGYSESDVEGIMHGNWLRFFEQAWR